MGTSNGEGDPQQGSATSIFFDLVLFEMRRSPMYLGLFFDKLQMFIFHFLFQLRSYFGEDLRRVEVTRKPRVVIRLRILVPQGR